MHAHTHAHAHMHVCTHAHTHVRMHVRMCVHTHRHTHRHTHTHTHTAIHTHTNTQTHRNTQTHTHAHNKQTNKQPSHGSGSTLNSSGKAETAVTNTPFWQFTRLETQWKTAMCVKSTLAFYEHADAAHVFQTQSPCLSSESDNSPTSSPDRWPLAVAHTA